MSIKPFYKMFWQFYIVRTLRLLLIELCSNLQRESTCVNSPSMGIRTVRGAGGGLVGRPRDGEGEKQRAVWSNNNMETTIFSQISKQVNVMVDACYNIVKNMPKDEQLRLLLLNLHRREQEKKEKKSITKEERGKKKKNMD